MDSDFLRELKSIAQESDNHRLKEIITSFEIKSPNNATLYIKELETKVKELEKEILNLKPDKSLKNNSGKETYEYIRRKNSELVKQKKRLTKKSEQLKQAHDQILKKNEELEDQTDYLHTATETISKMHNEVKSQKDEILRKNKELVKLNNEKNSLIGIVAHDLKSPLNQIKGLITVLKFSAKSLDEETVKHLDMIELSAERLNEMIAKILNVEAIESKNLNLNPSPVNLADVLKKNIKQFELIAGQKNITIEKSIEPNLIARADEDIVNQIFQNLISNAIKFSPKGKAISVTLSPGKGCSILEIKDQGPGISKEDQKKLYGKYQKLTAKPTGNETSTGLGLSIVKKYAGAIGARVWCESEEGQGASFFVKFPMP